MDTKARLDKFITQIGPVEILEVDGDSFLRVVVENAQAGNIIQVRAKLKGQQDSVLLKEIAGNANEKINVSTYEQVLINCSAVQADPIGVGVVRVIASSFNLASGSAITIDVPAGDDISDIDTLSFTSSDNTLTIEGNNVTKSIDFKVNVGALDEVKEYDSLVNFPAIGSTGVIYIAKDTEKVYRWSGSTYIEVSPSPVQSVNGQTGIVSLTKSDVGLGNVDNTSDLNKPISTATALALSGKEDVVNKSSDISLGVSDVLYPTQNAVKTYVDAAITAGAPDANSTTKGILKLTGDLGGTADSPTVPGLASKYDASNPAGYVDAAGAAAAAPVQSVSGKVGIVSLDKSDVGLNNVDNTSDINKPISTATQLALNAKQDTLGFTPENVANKSTDTSLGTSDSLYPSQNAVKVYVDSAVSAGAPDASSTTKGILKLTGDLGGTADSPTVPGLANKQDTLISTTNIKSINGQSILGSGDLSISGAVNSVNGEIGDVVLDKSSIGLGNVDNTSDADKPISTATQTALNAKYDASNPAGYITLAQVPPDAVSSVNGLTGAVVIPTGNPIAISDEGSQITASATSINFTGAGITASSDISGNVTVTVVSAGEATTLVVESYNETASTIPKMSVVYINGSHGNLPKLALSQGNAEMTSTKTLGIVRSDITSMNNGFVVATGRLEDLDTDIVGWNEGDSLWLSPTVAGGIQNSKPTAPNHAVFVGTLIRKHPTQGVIEVKIQNGYELEELHNVAISGISDGQVIRYENSTSLWKNVTLTKSDVGLSNVDNTSDANKPISSATQTALNAKQDTLVSATNIKTINSQSILGSGDLVISGGGAVDSVNGQTGVVVLTKADIGLSDVDNTSDVNKPISTATQTALNAKQDTLVSATNIKTINSQSILGSGNLSVSASWGGISGTLSSQTDLQNALDAKEAVANKSTSTSLGTSDTLYPTQNAVKVYVDNAVSSGGAVTSVNSLTGAVVLNKADIGLSNVDNTSDANKPISSATQTALNAKENTITAGTTAQYYRGDKTFQTLDKSAVGLSNVDNTSDANKPVSTATATALADKVAKSGDTMTGTLTVDTVSNTAASFKNINIGNLFGSTTSVISVKDGGVDPLWIQSADQLGSFAGNTSKAVTLASGFTTGANTGTVTIGSGTPGTTGNSGNAVISTGSAVGGNSGQIQIIGGTASGSSGAVFLQSGRALSTSTSATGAVSIASGRHDSATSGNTGATQIQSGSILSATSSGNTGNVVVFSGNTPGTGTSGQTQLLSGTTVSGNSGAILVSSGSSSGAGTTGNTVIRSGASSVTGTGSSGRVDLYSGFILNPASSAASGIVFMQSGDISGAGASGSAVLKSGTTVNGNSGLTSIESGASTSGTTGNVQILSGASSSGTTGNVILETGLTSGTRGSVIINSPNLNLQNNKIINTGEFYFGDPNTDGTYRIRPNGNNLITERRESGVWVVKQTITP